MATQSFMEMDIDEFEDKSEEVVDEPDLDFDFDDDVEETTAEDTSTNIESSDTDDYEKKYLEEINARKDKDPIELLEVAVGAKLPKDFAEGAVIFDTEDFSSAEIEHDGKVVFCVSEMWPVKRMVNIRNRDNFYLNNDKLFAIGDDGYGNAIVMNTENWCYYVWYHDTKKTILIAKAFSNEGTDPGYNITENDTLLGLLKKETNATDETITDDSSETPEIPEESNPDEPEVTQEGMFDVGFGNLRSKIAQALGEKFKVTNVGKGMGGKDKFDITEADADYDSTKTTVESTGTGCKVISRGDGKFKCHFNNIPLSQALNKILGLFEKPELLLEGAFYNISRSGGKLYMEDGEGNTDDDDTSDELPDLPEDDSENEDADNSSNEETTVEEDDIDISSFGSDTSDVQNEYDPGDIEILNKLIASENEAINDYFDGTKDTKDENLRTLYGDIGHEERFHLEQLLYAKSTLTGEKYEPRDPEVKKEYEELIAGGMDEDTAASTAIDKTSMFGSDNGDDSDIEELEQEAALIETMLVHNEILTTFCESQLDLIKGHHIIDKSVNVIMESFIQEEVDNVTTAPKQITKIQDPITLLAKGLKASINGLLRLSSVIRDSVAKSKIKRHRKYEWIKKHGIADLFRNGMSLYFYSDKDSKMDFDTPAQYVDMMYRLTKMIGESCGIKLTAAAKHRTISNPIKFGNIDEGLKKLNGAILTPTKVVVTDNNKDALAREFFGYSDEKIPVNVSHSEDGPVIKDSNNIYNKMEILSLTTKQYCDVSAAVLEQLRKFEGDVNSIYYKNRKAYNNAVEGMKTIVNRYNQFIKAMAHDLKVMLTLDNGILKMTRERDATEQTGGEWEGDDVRVSQKPEQGVQYTKA